MEQDHLPIEGEDVELPVEPDEESQPEVRLVTRKFNGDDYEMPEHLAKAWDERNAAYVKQLSDQAERIRRETAQQFQQRQQPAPTQDSQNPDAEWYESPSRVWARNEERLRNEFEQRLQIEEQRRVFWSDFWTENPDLVGKAVIVRAVLNENLGAMRDMSQEDGRAALASATRALLGSDSEPPRTRKPLPERQATSEPSRPPSPARRTPPREEGPNSVAASIRALQSQKRRASQFTFDKEK